MRIKIEIEPLPQSRPRFSGGRCYEEARIKNYKMELGYKAREAMKNQQPFSTPLKLQIKFWRKFKTTSRRYGDCDNLIKSVLDACNGILWTDDAQIVSLTAEKLQGTPRLEVEVLPVGTSGGDKPKKARVPRGVFLGEQCKK